MNILLLQQLLVSFFVGGSFVALLIFLSLQVNEKLSGIIIGLPTTSAVGLVFISLQSGAQVVSQMIPVTLISLSVTLLYVFVYVSVARKIEKKKFLSMILSILSAFVYWIVLISLFLKFKDVFLPYGIIIFIFSLLLSYFLFHRYPFQEVLPVHFSFKENLFRACIAGLLIAVVVFVSKIAGPFWGAAVSMFPAVFSITLLLVHYKYGVPAILKIFRKAPFGIFITMMFIVFYSYTSIQFGVGIGFLLAYGLDIVLAFLVWKLLQKINL